MIRIVGLSATLPNYLEVFLYYKSHLPFCFVFFFKLKCLNFDAFPLECFQVAQFLRVNPDTGLFFFDSSYRPVPLAQQYIGISEPNFAARNELLNEICYGKVHKCFHLDNFLCNMCLRLAFLESDDIVGFFFLPLSVLGCRFIEARPSGNGFCSFAKRYS